MRIKTDENISASGVDLLCANGHDVATVPEQGLAGADDERLFLACVTEGRTLITLDRDFRHVPRVQPQESAGIVILELGGAASQRLLHDRLRDFISVSVSRAAIGEPWIVEPGRVRVRLEKDEE